MSRCCWPETNGIDFSTWLALYENGKAPNNWDGLVCEFE